jgi:hypothetical protein
VCLLARNLLQQRIDERIDESATEEVKVRATESKVRAKSALISLGIFVLRAR